MPKDHAARQAPPSGVFAPRPLLGLGCALLMGLCLGARLWPAWFWAGLWATAALAGAAVLARGSGKAAYWLMALGVAALGCGLAAGALTEPLADDHIANLATGGYMALGGRVVTPPAISLDKVRMGVALDQAAAYGQPLKAARGRLWLTLPHGAPGLVRGDYVRFMARPRRVDGFANPGGFDYARYLAGQGFWAEARVSDPRLIVRLSQAGRGGFWGRVDRFRAQAAQAIEKAARPRAAGVLEAMLLGRRGAVEPQVNQAFTRLGVNHVLAVSGLHVSLVAAAAFFLVVRGFFWLGGLTVRLRPAGLAALAALVAIAAYTALAGARPSTLRAAIMGGCLVLALAFERRADALSALGCAALLIGLAMPLAVLTPAFQLSFLAAAGIILALGQMPRPATGAAPGRPRRLVRAGAARLGQLALVSLAAFAATAPLAAWHFGHLPWLSLAANITLAPVVLFLGLGLGLPALAVFPVAPHISGALFGLAGAGLEHFFGLLELAAAWPGIDPLVPRPRPVFLLVYYGGWLAFFTRRTRAGRLATAGLAPVLLAVALVLPASLGALSQPRLDLTVLDVGQGLAVHAGFPDGTQLVYDAGGFPGSRFDPGEGLITPYLLARGVSRLDILALSHPHPDHYLGLGYLVRRFGPREFWHNGARARAGSFEGLMGQVEGAGVLLRGPAQLERARAFGGARLRVLWPPVGQMFGEPNDGSLTLKIELGRVGFLLTGDLEEEGLAGLLARHEGELKADVLLAPHHGSARSMTRALLEAVRPRYVVFSAAGRGGLPSPRALGMVRRFGARAVRTDLDGAVSFTTNGDRLTLSTARRR